MSKRIYPLVAALLLFGLLLVACGGEVQQAVEEIAPTVEAAVEEVAPTVEAALEEAQEEAPAEEEAAPVEEEAPAEEEAAPAEEEGMELASELSV